MFIKDLIKKILFRIRADYTTESLVSMGLKVGKNFQRNEGVIIDPSHCWLIEIGDNVIMAPRVHILAHDLQSSGLCKNWQSNNWGQCIYWSK